MELNWRRCRNGLYFSISFSLSLFLAVSAICLAASFKTSSFLPILPRFGPQAFYKRKCTHQHSNTHRQAVARCAIVDRKQHAPLTNYRTKNMAGVALTSGLDVHAPSEPWRSYDHDVATGATDRSIQRPVPCLCRCVCASVYMLCLHSHTTGLRGWHQRRRQPVTLVALT